MKRSLFFWMMGLWVTMIPAISAEDPLSSVHTSLKDQAFVVETDETSDSESLERISGHYDLGFSLPEQSYDSEDHYRPGPFGRAEAADRDQRY